MAFTIRTRARFFLGSWIADGIDAHPVLALAVAVAAIAVTLCYVVLVPVTPLAGVDVHALR
jgi:hypothetical protein